MIVLVSGVTLAAVASPLVFLGNPAAALVGMVLWGIGMGTQESAMRAVVAGMTAPDRRATTFGIFNAVFGVAWFGGSAILGILYDRSVFAVAAVSFALQIFAVPLLLFVMSNIARRKPAGSG
jgi:predicted MFS family arabinose efflux permease